MLAFAVPKNAPSNEINSQRRITTIITWGWLVNSFFCWSHVGAMSKMERCSKDISIFIACDYYLPQGHNTFTYVWITFLLRVLVVWSAFHCSVQVLQNFVICYLFVIFFLWSPANGLWLYLHTTISHAKNVISMTNMIEPHILLYNHNCMLPWTIYMSQYILFLENKNHFEFLYFKLSFPF